MKNFICMMYTYVHKRGSFKFIRLILCFDCRSLSLTLVMCAKCSHLVVLYSIAMYRLKNAYINCVTKKFTIIFEWATTTMTAQGNGVQVTQWACMRCDGEAKEQYHLYMKISVQTSNTTLKEWVLANKNAFDVESNSMYCVLKTRKWRNSAKWRWRNWLIEAVAKKRLGKR